VSARVPQVGFWLCLSAEACFLGVNPSVPVLTRANFRAQAQLLKVTLVHAIALPGSIPVAISELLAA